MFYVFSYSGQHSGQDIQHGLDENVKENPVQIQPSSQKVAFQNPAILLDDSDEVMPHGKLSFDLQRDDEKNKQTIYTISSKSNNSEVRS